MNIAVTTRRSARKPKGDGHLRRAEILEAAERIFVAEGYEGATIRKIADEVGVSSTALYMHFPDKSCILLEICQGTIRQLLERNAEIAAKPMDATNRVKLMLDAYMRWGLAHPNAYELVFCNAARLIAVIGEEPTTADLGDQCYQVFSGVVREIAADGRLRTGTADSAAQALWTSCHGLVSMMIARPKFEWAPTDELIQVTLEGLMHGLVAD
ncbi:TetR family transcriptional regulator [Phenylobacterium sp. Root77]|uniref:TetR/AcrR family transcriptional regulator n=1 Tax=unclassified Phenylobacterium TaxID=2640670 RepID=UPI0006FCA1ED|nr:TetR family transcriptional regulator [Phenylobacterium sp. Root1277]KQW94338.1 TetR family transcriptional regulator [Phenylobacterium sp. Root1290]KRC44032.1 TetR family transcriptional regulator [Phenylobacterium sp. Root77]